MNDKPDIPHILYIDFPARSDNHLRNLAGIRRYASARGWDVVTLPREETTPAAVKAICAGANDAPPPIGCVVEASGGHHNILPPRLFGNVPIVYLDPPKPLPWRGADAVTCDHAAVAKAAFEELADAMPPCFAVVASDSGLPWNKERIAAFGALCIADGRELRVFPTRSGERPERRISRLSKWLAALPKHSAVFAVNDATALVIAEAALTIPRHIPKELVLLGVDGEPDAEDHGPFRAFGERPGLSLTQNFILGDERFFSPETDTDVRATGIAGSGTGQSISMILGSDELYSANYSQFGANNGWFAIGGIVGTQTSIDGATYRRPAYKASSGWVYPSGENEWVKQGTWLRFTVEADLDAGTYSFTIRDQGTTHPGGDAADGETVYYSKSGIASVKAVTSISSIALTAYNSSVMFDNIKVWHRPTGASAETLVYDNRFTTRTTSASCTGAVR